MVSPFLILKLPLLTQTHIFQYFSAIDIINFSFISTKVRDTLRTVRLRSVEYKVKFDSEYPHIVTVYKKDDGLNEHTATWKFMREGSLENYETKELRIGCHRFKNCYTNGNTIASDYHNPNFGLSVVFNHIFDILPGPVNLFLHLHHIRNLHAILLNEKIAKCKNVYITEGFTSASADHNLNEILESMKIEKELKAYLDQEDELDVDLITGLESLTLESANWLTPFALSSLKCRSGKFIRHKFDQSAICSFAENWFNSNDTKLERMQFGWDEQVPFIPTSKDLKWESWDPKIRSRYYHMKNETRHSNRIDCSKGFDVTRSDGLTATFLLQNHYDCTVSFFVWHDKHPEKARLKELDVLVSQEVLKFENVLKTRNTTQAETEIGDVFRNVIGESDMDRIKYAKIKKELYVNNKEIFELYEAIAQNIIGLKNEISKWKRGETSEKCDDD